MSKRRPQLVIEGAKGKVVIRLWGKSWRIKATAFDGDPMVEMELALHAAKLMQEVARSAAGDPTLRLVMGSIRHIDDHEASA